MPSKKHLDKTTSAQAKELIAISNRSGQRLLAKPTVLPTAIVEAGRRAEFAYEEFLYGTLRNRYTRRNYRQAIERFFRWRSSKAFHSRKSCRNTLVVTSMDWITNQPPKSCTWRLCGICSTVW